MPSVFRNCKYLEKVAFSKDCALRKLGHWALCGTTMKTFSTHPALKEISKTAFQDCEQLKSITLSEGLERIGCSDDILIERPHPGPFWGSGLRHIVIPASVQEINAGAFGNCKHLKSVDFAKGSKLEKLSHGAFYGCKKLKTVVLNEGLRVIGTDDCYEAPRTCPSVFEDSGVTRVTVPVSVQKIEACVFSDCKQLKSVVFAKGIQLEAIDLGVFRKTALKTFVAPASLKSISQAAFYQCKHLKSVVLNDGLEVIGSD